jgi:hypothetical protein
MCLNQGESHFRNKRLDIHSNGFYIISQFCTKKTGDFETKKCKLGWETQLFINCYDLKFYKYLKKKSC